MGPREISNRLAALAERFVGRGSAPTGTVKDLELADQIREVLVPVQAECELPPAAAGRAALGSPGPAGQIEDEPVSAASEGDPDRGGGRWIGGVGRGSDRRLYRPLSPRSEKSYRHWLRSVFLTRRRG